MPAWYDALSEKDRWAAQARFWQAVAGRCAGSPAVFCYDLMNEPVVPGGRRKAGDWLGPAFAGKHFVQFITLDQGKRPRTDIARQWVADAGDGDPQGGSPASRSRWGWWTGASTARPVDFRLRPREGRSPISISSASTSIPKKGKVDEALETLEGFAVGKPVVIEETFPLSCSIEELGKFFDGSKKTAAGWIGFYWGQSAEAVAPARRRSATC